MAWDERFSEGYDEWSSSMTADIDFYRQLAQRSTGPIVELAIGDGRVAIPIAKSLGVPIIGFDLSPAMLARARTRAAAAGVELDLRLGDIREFAVDEPAGFIYCPFRSLLHLPTWTGRRQLFERVAAPAPV
jgi:ubiquinone/menaquinone biosynthesis C-methylase UbiE